MISNELFNFINLKPIKWLWLVVLIIIIVIAVLLMQVVYSTYDTSAIVNKIDNKYYLLMSLDFGVIEKINNQKELMIDEKVYKYKIIKIEDELEMINDVNYQNVILKIDLDNKYKNNNLIVKTKIIMKQDILFHKILNILLERE